MKATGIVRRIDDLGRVIIPREVRRTLNIREGDPLELYTMDGGIVFKPYSPLASIENYAWSVIEAMKASCKTNAAIFDHSANFVAGFPSFKHWRSNILHNDRKREFFYLDKEQTMACQPIVAEGELFGYIIYSTNDPDATAAATMGAKMLGYTLSR